MAKYANQKKITINRKDVYNSKKQFLAIVADTLFEASRLLNDTGLRVYLYLVENKDGYEKEISPQHIANLTGISRSSVYTGLENLKKNGYIIEQDGKTMFYEEPQQIEQILRKLVPNENDGFTPMTYQQVYNELIKDGLTEEEIKNNWNEWEDEK